jgi:hypothetical protein
MISESVKMKNGHTAIPTEKIMLFRITSAGSTPGKITESRTIWNPERLVCPVKTAEKDLIYISCISDRSLQ